MSTKDEGMQWAKAQQISNLIGNNNTHNPMSSFLKPDLIHSVMPVAEARAAGCKGRSTTLSIAAVAVMAHAAVNTEAKAGAKTETRNILSSPEHLLGPPLHGFVLGPLGVRTH